MSTIGSAMTMLVGRQGFMKAQATMDRAMERLTTGKRINRSSDDPSGMIAADALGARRVRLEETIQQQELASRMLDRADGALSVISELAVELSGLTVRAANTAGTTGAEREAMQIEANGIISAMVHIIENSNRDGSLNLTEGLGMMLNGRWIGYNGMDPEHLGRTSVEVTDPETGETRTAQYTVHDLRNGALNLIDGDMESAQKVAESLVKDIAHRRAAIGMQQKYTYGHQLDAIRSELENTAAAESLIRDADFAKEMSTLIRGQVMREASMAVMQIAQQQAKKALQLLS